MGLTTQLLLSKKFPYNRKYHIKKKTKHANLKKTINFVLEPGT